MDFPEIIFGNVDSLEWARVKIRHAMTLDTKLARQIHHMSKCLKGTYTALEPYFRRYIEKVCKECENPCCVNRHGFPDFEDLIIFCALGECFGPFDCTQEDTEPCQFLGEKGCTLQRCERSYRCTWYFCDKVFDRFEAEDQKAFARFERLMDQLCQQRIDIIKSFKRLWHLELGTTRL